MDARTARRAVVGALTAGIVADLLFDRVALGINVPLATLGAVALVAWFGRAPDRRPGPADPLDWWLTAVAGIASLGPALRTDPSVVFLDLWLIAVAVAAFAFAVGGVPVTRRATRQVALLGVQAGVAVVTGLIWLLARVGADGALRAGAGHLGRAAPYVRGTLIAIPVLAGFALLLGSADAIFGHALDELLRLPDLGDLVGRAAFSTAAAAVLAGPIAIAAGAPELMRAISAAATPADAAPAAARVDGEAPSGARRSGATEAVVVLVAVDLLFALFAVVQVVYLFGGADTLAVVGMTYSDYARQGYFQLVGVVALAGLLLVGAHEMGGRPPALLTAGIALLVLTGVILASAALRLKLYQDAYGWTELRFFVAASIAWLAAAVILALAALAADRMRWLPHGLAVSGVAITLLVSAIGPQAFVMEQNLARVLDPRLVPPGGHSGFDLEYGLSLGDDAVPALVAALPALPPLDRAVAVDRLYERRTELRSDVGASGWPSWNFARERARTALDTLP